MEYSFYILLVRMPHKTIIMYFSYIQVLFLYIGRILVGVASAINPFIYATTIPKFKETMKNFSKSFVSGSKTVDSGSKMKGSENFEIKYNKAAFTVSLLLYMGHIDKKNPKM